MPRRTAKSKSKNENITVKSVATRNTKQKNAQKEKCIKKELDLPKERIVQEVVHRKSERRRVQRDIFLVFEEESSSKKKTRSNKKQSKPKFGHLKIDEPVRPKGLLRDIKNEPKCYITSGKVNATILHDIPVFKPDAITESGIDERKLKNEENKKNKTCGLTKKLNNVKSLKFSTLESESCILDNGTNFVARVNPIFLWVKQDDTQIVEVRCEDYDKRNRIRITKTANGWRSVPRSDPTTSRILKFNPTHLMKVKRENIQETSNIFNSKCEKKSTLLSKDFSIPNILTKTMVNDIESKVNEGDTICNPLAFKSVKSKNKKSKRAKKKSQFEKPSKKSKIKTAEIDIVVNETNTLHLNPPISIKSSETNEFSTQIIEVLNCPVNKNQLAEIALTENSLSQDFAVDFYKNDAEVSNTCIVTPTSSQSSNSLKTKSTYQAMEEEVCYHLCPKTGLFLPNIVNVEYDIDCYKKLNDINSKVEKNYFNSNKTEFDTEVDKINTDQRAQISDENTESLEAKTKNLKDLLDDADLLQNCDDNANSDADLIDNLVKTSCENNLIQANEIITKANVDHIQHKSLQVTNEMAVQLIANVSDPPKCLSFNEAGEIEDLSEELFQSNAFMESFDKQPSDVLTDNQVILHSTSVEEATASTLKTSLGSSLDHATGNIDQKVGKSQTFNETDESPKDLSYKKREEVCPQSESRSQCAVTSSSDVIKSPQHEHALSLVSPSETLKNLILEQFIKLNSLSAMHQRETKDNEIQRHSTASNIKSGFSSKPEQSSNLIETVVIDDDNSDHEIEEPLKKRLRLLKHKPSAPNKLTIIDKDPDPLTQLRLLIRNTQWKVPDPILVPKERLSAVLASPAREIPLLITTRPELRLPEAFAYPEIIQNPNILVISMAQLEAILKNELEVEKTTSMKSIKTDTKQLSEGQEICQPNALTLPSFSEKHIQVVPKHTKNISTNTSLPASNIQESSIEIAETMPTLREDSKIAQTNSSDLNSAAMTVLNQMLWLPYFGHISQEIGKLVKNPTLKDKCSNSVINLEEILRSSDNKLAGNAALNTGLQCFQQQFKTNEEISLFQKIVQHQMESVLRLNQISSDPAKIANSATAEDVLNLKEKSKSKTESPSNLIEQKKQKLLSSNKQNNTYICKTQTNTFSQNISLPEKSYNLRSSVAGRHSNESNQYSNNNQRQISDNKPRLTCKSLSNLLDPEHTMMPSSSSHPYRQNLTSFVSSDDETKRSSTEDKIIERSSEQKGQFLANSAIVPQSQKICGSIDVNIASCSEINKDKSKTMDQSSLTNDASSLLADSNVPLWHPLFGSNTKNAYSSPWQWTTVTATGE